MHARSSLQKQTILYFAQVVESMLAVAFGNKLLVCVPHLAYYFL